MSMPYSHSEPNAKRSSKRGEPLDCFLADGPRNDDRDDP